MSRSTSSLPFVFTLPNSLLTQHSTSISSKIRLISLFSTKPLFPSYRTQVHFLHSSDSLSMCQVVGRGEEKQQPIRLQYTSVSGFPCTWLTIRRPCDRDHLPPIKPDLSATGRRVVFPCLQQAGRIQLFTPTAVAVELGIIVESVPVSSRHAHTTVTASGGR